MANRLPSNGPKGLSNKVSIPLEFMRIPDANIGDGLAFTSFAKSFELLFKKVSWIYQRTEEIYKILETMDEDCSYSIEEEEEEEYLAKEILLVF